MQKTISMTEKEFDRIKWDIITEIHEFSKKPYGFKMISRENGEEITDDMEIHGMLLPSIEHVFDQAFDETLQAQLRWIRATRGETI